MPHASIISRISALIEKIEVFLVTLSSITLCLIMVIVFADVLMRYVFSAPFGWSYDVIGLYLLVAVFFLALPDTLHQQGHIAVDLFQPLIPFRLRHFGEGVGYLATTTIIMLISYQAYDRMVAAFVGGDRTVGIVSWPTWVSHFIVVVGAGALAIRCAYRAVGHLATAITGRLHVETAQLALLEDPSSEML